jgi:hypothetical protein
MERVGVEQRRARLGVRHHLAAAARASTPAQAARGVVALHSTDPASVFLSVWARTTDAAPEAIEQALYEERSLVRMLGMRRTTFIVPAQLAPVIQAACTTAIAARPRELYTRFLVAAGVGGRVHPRRQRGGDRPAGALGGAAARARPDPDGFRPSGTASVGQL